MSLTPETRLNRRGVLLLLVLSVLSLFLLMGAVLLTVATRARTAARGFASAAGDPEASTVMPRAMLDEALLILIRGAADNEVPGPVSESLLGDMYGEDGNKVPFRDEPFDAFGTDAFLTEFDDNGTVTTAAFANDEDIEVDNDADGVADGVWLEGVLPDIASPSGGTLSFRVSYLVSDLDARINVNAHGGGGGDDPVGPASIDASNLPPFEDNGWTLVQNGGTRTANADAAPSPRRQSPVLGRPVAGRGGNAYGLRLDRDAPRPATLTGLANQNPFTPGELERVLRPFDPDCSTLPPRLAALLSDLDGSARRLITTDSWDVTCKVGPAASADVAEPQRRFDLTSTPDDKQRFADALFEAISPATIAGNGLATAQWVANVAEFRAALTGSPVATAPLPLTFGDHTVTGVSPSDLRETGGIWVGTEGFVSSGELAGIPMGSKTEIEEILDSPLPITPLVSLVSLRPIILEAVEVPSRFTETRQRDPAREPGRVNVNTCSDEVWRIVAGGNQAVRPPRPSRRLWDVLALAGFRPTVPIANLIPPDVRLFNRDQANRLGSLVTVRSNVFAVWITLEVSDSSTTADSPTCHRLFAIVDRSIPVDYYEGENRNVRQTIRLKRFLN